MYCDSLAREKGSLEQALRLASEASSSTELLMRDQQKLESESRHQVESVQQRLRRLCDMADRCGIQSAQQSRTLTDSGYTGWEEMCGLLEFKIGEMAEALQEAERASAAREIARLNESSTLEARLADAEVPLPHCSALLTPTPPHCRSTKTAPISSNNSSNRRGSSSQG